ncbi:MAG TPA: outer membrane beta-barrel protein, partial [Gemmatimonadales bacterium]
YVAPNVRVLFGLSYFKANFSARETQKFAAKLAQLVNDPDSNFTVDVGTISWSDLTGDVDLQYRIPQSRTVIAYLGLGAGVHVRHGSGQAIAGTFVQDALSDVTAAFNGSVGAEFAVDRNVRLTLDGRVVWTSNLSTVSLRGGLMYRFPGRR